MATSTNLARPLGHELGLGDHIAFFFKEDTERAAFVIPYMLRGLQNHELCVYITHENPVAKILDEFKDAGVDAGAAIADGALKVLTVKETYLRHGIFEPVRMIADLDDDVSTALRAGRSGLRVTGEMSWALDLPSAVSRLCYYEEVLRQRWPVKLGGLCQYDESLFPNELVERMAGCHHVVVRGGKVIHHHPQGQVA
ncbi:MAG TPA: MEDS domain-containing protein [Terriglobales bacterium]|nr:MEDS domain-containing protein [Terriglobales bacterium]